MKLVCINSEKIVTIHGHIELVQIGSGLVEGQIYETIAKPCYDEYNNECFYITGLGRKLKIRFAELLDENATKQELEETLKNKDYLKIAELRDSKK